MISLRLLLPFATALGLFLLCRPMMGLAPTPDLTKQAREFIKGHDQRIRPLDVAAGIAWWNANTTGKDEDFEKKVEAQNRIDAALSDKKIFAELKALKEKSADVSD